MIPPRSVPRVGPPVPPRRGRWATGAVVAVVLSFVGPIGLAAPRRKHAPAAAHGKARSARPVHTAVPTPRPTATATGSSGAPPARGEVGDGASETDGGAVLATGPTSPATSGVKSAKTKVYTFGAMDVEGKLKTPQLLYFLNRVKLELEMSAPDQRSFMKELARTADDPNL